MTRPTLSKIKEFASCCGTVVKHLAQNPKIMGSNPAAGNEVEKMTKEPEA
jgi:hypothetical protein